MRLKQPKILFPSKEKRPKQDIPTEAARIKARMAHMPIKSGEDAGSLKTKTEPKARS